MGRHRTGSRRHLRPHGAWPSHLYKGVFYVRNDTTTEAWTMEQLDRTAPAASSAVLPEQFAPPPAEGFRGRHRSEGTSVLAHERRGIVIVDGISGIGKTALLVAFTGSIGERPGLLDGVHGRDIIRKSHQGVRCGRPREGTPPARECVRGPTRRQRNAPPALRRGSRRSDLLLILDDYHLVVDALLDCFVLRVAERATHPPASNRTY